MGVKYIFGIPAGSINALYDAMLDIPELKPIVVKHETSAGYMAAAYTRITGIPSVCVGSSGPGATNLVTAAANAWVEKLPVLFITGSVPSTKLGKGGAQELNAEPIFAPITKMSKTVLDPNRLPDLIAEAYYTAINGVPGPVHLAIPINIQMTEIGHPRLPQLPKTEAATVDENAVKRAAEWIADAGTKGAVLLGHGAKSARHAIIRFAEQRGWFVATTPRGKGAFPENHPLSLGVYGLAGNPRALETLSGNGHEVLLVVGSSLGELATCNWNPQLAEGKKLLHIDIDAAVFGKNYLPDIAICGDAAVVMEKLLSHLNRLTPIPPRTNTDSGVLTGHRPAASPGEPPCGYDTYERDKPYEPLGPDSTDWNTLTAIRQFGACAPAHTRFYSDIGELMTYAIQNLRISEEQEFDIDINFGAMGSAIGGAIGAKLAEPDRPVICFTGDGCFFMHGMEILTAKHYGIPLVLVVINNARLGMVYHGHMLQYKRCHDDFSQQRVHIADVARHLGIRSVQVQSLAELQPDDVQLWLSFPGPVVVEVVVDGNEIPPMGERVKFLEGAVY
jgi:acetolactate synthase-1/2/3 large subunit